MPNASLRSVGVNRLALKLMQPYWRLRRGLTLGAQGVVIDADDRVLLVRHTYRPGWFFSGGGVEWGETLEMALARELAEEADVELTGQPQLHGVFANFKRFPGDHVALFVVRQWQRSETPRTSTEIAETGFFALDALPTGTGAATRRRLAEIFEGALLGQNW
jgi:ADP-ribose pyrophosphatase YjhB (NUDIX family)